MGYESPINVIYGQMRVEFDGQICKAVQGVGINVDKEELIRALEHDRWQYQKGYADRDREITRCGECRLYLGNGWCNRSGIHLEVNDNWFCADGTPKE